MIRVMVVEDEPPTLRRIAGLVEQLDPSFSVVATAMNGRAALAKMEETHVDAVLTDIRMPVMNGMELMDRIRARYPECILVVLSGYQDFEYASHAIRAQSLDYLLKPVSAEDMRGLLARVRAQYTRMRRERLQRSLSMQGNRPAAPGHTGAEGEAMGLCLFCAGGFPLGDDAEMYPAAGYWNDRSLERLAAEIVPSYTGFTWEFMGNTHVERILIFQTADAELEAWCECLHEALLSAGGTPVSCAYLCERVPLMEVSGALRWLRRALRDNIRVGRSVLLKVDRKDTAKPDKPGDDEEIWRLSKLLAAGQARPIQDMLARMDREQWTQQRMLNLFDGAARRMEHDDRRETRELARQYRVALADAVCTALSPEELSESIQSLLAPPGREAKEEPLRQEAVLHAVEQYLRERYAGHITNQTLAAEFGYVPSYISMLFRQRFGVSPSEYLTQIRMKEAKRLMKEQPDLLIREVAEQVGYKSQHHFSRLFKKIEGIWPTGYRF